MTEKPDDEVAETSQEENSPSSTSKMADNIAPKEQDVTNVASERILPQESHDKMLDNILLEQITATSYTNRTESTATDDSGIAAEFGDYQNLLLDEDNESVLGNSQNNSLKSSTSSFTTQDSVESPVNSPRKSDSIHLARTPERRKLSTEDEPSSPRQRWWSPHRAVCSESLDSIAEEKRRSKL